MTTYQVVSIGRIAGLVALSALFLALATRRLSERRQRILVASVVVAAALSYPNFGVLHEHGDRHRHIHLWDTFHYFMGAKYLPELGYSHLYEATYVAGRQLGGFADATTVRDLTTDATLEGRTIDVDAVVARFSPSRWAAFVGDCRFFFEHIRQWPLPLNDHGYNDPPPRAWLLHLIVRNVPATSTSLTVMSHSTTSSSSQRSSWWAWCSVRFPPRWPSRSSRSIPSHGSTSSADRCCAGTGSLPCWWAWRPSPGVWA